MTEERARPRAQFQASRRKTLFGETSNTTREDGYAPPKRDVPSSIRPNSNPLIFSEMPVNLDSIPRVYLAGPDVFFVDALHLARKRQDFLAGLGMEGVFPLDTQQAGQNLPTDAHTIFKANRELIDSCHAVLANVSPFRGPSADVGTAWEMGYASGQGKPVVAYSDDLSVYRDKVFRGGWSSAPAEARDKDGNEIEDFGGTDNLMLTQSVIAICATFEEAAAALKRFLAQWLEVSSLGARS